MTRIADEHGYLARTSVATFPKLGQARLEIGSPGFTIEREPPAFLVHAGEVAHVQPVG